MRGTVRRFIAMVGVIVAVALIGAMPAGAKSTPTVGTKITIPNGTVKLYAYEQPVSADGTGQEPADAGSEYAAADVEACSTAVKKQQVTPFLFSVSLPDGSTEHATSMVKQPAMTSALLTKGKCVRGWVTFEVPQGTRAKHVVFGVTGGTTYKWKVPPA